MVSAHSNVLSTTLGGVVLCRVILFSAEHRKKAFAPIESTFSGMLICSKPEQP